ncbi:MAG: DUF126 domain-containing protein [Pseudomonadota bacterium]
MIVYNCHPGIGPAIEGVALVANDDFSARYDLDRLKGVVSRPGHALFGEAYDGKVLVLNTAKGGVASAWMLYEMKMRGICPKAILFNQANTILAQGAAFADLTLCDRFDDGDVTSLFKTGDHLQIDPAAGRVTVTNRDA